MAHFKRARPRLRTYSRRWYRWHPDDRHKQAVNRHWLSGWPAWHDILHHRRPHRRATKAAERAALRGADPDALIWPVAKRPHIYYW